MTRVAKLIRGLEILNEYPGCFVVAEALKIRVTTDLNTELTNRSKEALLEHGWVFMHDKDWNRDWWHFSLDF